MDNLTEQIKRLKKEKNALVLAHYYAPLEIWETADAIGDSLELSRRAAKAEENLIVFCGVRFMAESAKILNPAKKVLLPVSDAGCPMADQITPSELRRLKEEHPDAAAVCYVNSSAAVKAECDICCTSGNAVKVVQSLPQKKIIFVPDKNLGGFVASHCPDKEFVFINGCCPVHNDVTRIDIQKSRLLHPKAKVACHPECAGGVSELSDFVGSTTGIMNFCRESDAEEFIIGTEIEIVRALEKELPNKRFHIAKNGFVCHNMKKNTLSALLTCLEKEEEEILLPDEILKRAKEPLDRMIAL